MLGPTSRCSRRRRTCKSAGSKQMLEDEELDFESGSRGKVQVRLLGPVSAVRK